jgi:hypothetical protein
LRRSRNRIQKRRMAKAPKVATTIRFGASGETLNRLIASTKRGQIIVGPLGSGKTTTVIQKMLKLCLTQPVDRNGHRRSRWCAIRNTYPDLETTTIPDFREVFTDDIGEFKHSNPPQFNADIPLPDGTRAIFQVWFIAMDQPDDVKKLRGFQLTGGWANEAKELPKSAIDMLDGRLGRYPKRQDLPKGYWHGIIGDTNAPDDDHWIAEASRNPPPGWEVFIQPGGLIKINGKWEPNPLAENLANLPENYYVNVRANKNADWIAVNLGNEFGTVRDGKPVHPDFSRQLHVSRVPLTPWPHLPIICGIDFGRTPAAAIFQIGINNESNAKQVQVLDELVTEDMGARRFGKLLKDHLNNKYAGFKFHFHGDPAGEELTQADEQSPYDMLALSGIDCLPAWTNDPVIRQNALDMFLTEVIKGVPSIIFDPECKTLTRGLEKGYHFRRLQVSGQERYHDRPSKNKFSHVVEGLHYGLLGEGEADALIGFGGATNEQEEVEMNEDFSGWHPSNTGV